MARMGLHDQPYFATGGQLQGVARGQGELNFHLHSDINASGDDDVAPHQRDDSALKNVAGAETFGATGGQ